MEAITREEKIISGENLTPITRKEMFLAKAAGQDVKTPLPITREEMFLNRISGGGGGGAELNIAYGDTAPEDTSKLWVKTTEPSGVIVSPNLEKKQGSSDAMKLYELSALVPTVTSHSTAAAVDDVVYVFGGMDSVGASNIISKLNISTGVTTTLSVVLPRKTNNATSVAVNGKIYVIGGYNGRSSNRYNTILCFDPITETFTTVSATLPQGVYGAGCDSVGSNIYIMGGYGLSSVLNTILCYNTETDTITTVPTTLPQPMYGFGSSAVENKLYLFGGNTGSGRLNTILCFDTETQEISTMTETLPYVVNNTTSANIGSNVYIFGGYTGSNSSDGVLCFNTETCAVQTLSVKFPTGKTGLCAVEAKDKIYIFNGGYSPNLGAIYCFDEGMVVSLPKDVVQIIPSNDNVFRLVDILGARIEIGANKAYKGNDNDEGEQVEVAIYKNGSWTNI